MSDRNLHENMQSISYEKQSAAPAAVARTVDACAYLNVSRATLYRLVQAGKLKQIALGARAVGYSYRDLDAFIDSAAT